MFKSFADILMTAPDVAAALKGHERYWAHTHTSKAAESLAEHVALVNAYAVSLVSAHHLDSVVDSLISEHVAKWEEALQCAALLKECFVGVIAFHDFGKINENFQVLRMRNKQFTQKHNTLLKPAHGHSLLSVFIYLSYFVERIYSLTIPEKSKVLLVAYCFFMGYSIMQHHSPALFNLTEKDGYLTCLQGMFDEMSYYSLQYEFPLSDTLLKRVLNSMETVWNTNIRKQIDSPADDFVPFPFFALIKLNFSLLTAADYLATHEYANSKSGGKEGLVTDFGVFEDRDRLTEIVQHLQKFRHNRNAFARAEGYSFEHPLDVSEKNLNRLREEMAVESIQTIRKHKQERLFYLEAPTGGGKTNLSAIAATELLGANLELNKVFYVFPFTTLITQTYASLQDSMGLRKDELVELHSNASFGSKVNAEAHEDGLYGDQKKDYIDHLFALYPVTLLSHVKFFDILKTSKKESNYLLHRLANSVVIIDELQSYNPDAWDKIVFFVSQYAKHFNIRFVLMSATLPKISQLTVGLKEISTSAFIDLLPNARNYITNPNFANRVHFNFEFFQHNPITQEQLLEAVVTKSKAYASTYGHVKTIVEFIFKNSAAAFQGIIQNSDFFDQIFILSGTVLESRRKEIINYIKYSDEHPNESILLITTQVVEAGVDIDMDLGFKNISLLDSDEQLAGRVNRNAGKSNCEVYLFKMDDARILYGRDFRYKKTREEIPSEEYQSILATKNFATLYKKVLLHIDSLNRPLFNDSIQNYKDLLFDFNYPEVDRGFRIIDQDSVSVFVPLQVPIAIRGRNPGTREDIFACIDLSFLELFGIVPDELNHIDGEEIWSLYERLIDRQKAGKKEGFDIVQKVNFKILQSIMSKFSFSLLDFSKDYQQLREFGEEKYGYLYLSLWSQQREEGQPYEYNNGLNSEVFKTAHFL